MRDVAVVAYCRTGIARAARGALNQTHGIPLTAHVLRHAVKRAGIDPAEVEDVVVGCGLPEGATGHNVARNAALEAGFRECGAGRDDQSLLRLRAERRIDRRQPHRRWRGHDRDRRQASRASASSSSTSTSNGFFYAPLQQRMPAVWWTMNQTADFVAKKYGISREAQDAYVVRSQERVAAAAAAGKFAEEIVPFTTTMKVTDKVTQTHRDEEVTLDRDEGPRPDTTLAGLAALKPVYPGGTTTAGNASQLSDGAAAVVLMDADVAARRGLPMLGLFRGMQLAAVAPEEMSIAIAPAIRRLLKQSPARDVGRRSVGAPRGVRGDHALQPGAARDAVGDHERKRGRGAARPSLWHVGYSIPGIHAARARSPTPSARDRRRVHGRRDVDCRLPRATVRLTDCTTPLVASQATRMAADRTRHVTWMGLEVRDSARYARYRERMGPILTSLGGRFDHDFEVARVLTSSASPRINRVFALSFPDADARARFLADERYRQIRAELFEPSVASHEILAQVR